MLKKKYRIVVKNQDKEIFSILQKVNKDVKKIFNAEGIEGVQQFLIQSVLLTLIATYDENYIQPGYTVYIDGELTLNVTEEYLNLLKSSIEDSRFKRGENKSGFGFVDFKRVSYHQLLDERQTAMFASLSFKYKYLVLENFKKSSREAILNFLTKAYSDVTEDFKKEFEAFKEKVLALPDNVKENPSSSIITQNLIRFQYVEIWNNWEDSKSFLLKDKDFAFYFINAIKEVYENDLPPSYEERKKEVEDHFSLTLAK